MFRKISVLILGFVLCFCTGCVINPITGQEELMLFGEQHDIELGRAYAPEVEKELKGRIDNNDLQDYIDVVGQRVARVSHKPYFEYNFVAVKDESINALALPGGYIFITQGMLREFKSEAQLASVLAHEITHIVARHVSSMMSREIGINLLLAFATPKNTPPELLQAAELARQIMGLKFSRTDEQEADFGGLDYMVAAGYDPYAMVETMKILEDKQKVEQIDFFSTHPSPHNRQIYLKERIETRYHNLTGLKVGEKEYNDNVLKRLKKPDKPDNSKGQSSGG